MTEQQQKELAIIEAFPYNPIIYEQPTKKNLNISHTVYPKIKNIFTLGDWERLEIFKPEIYKKLKGI